MLKKGLKVGTADISYIKSIDLIFQSKMADFIELYIVPESYKTYLEYWSLLKYNYVIHAPHYSSGMNLTSPEKVLSNRKLAEEAMRFADILSSDKIIFHSGVIENNKCSIEETAHQLLSFNDTRIIIENKPALGLNNEVCAGYSADDLKKIISFTGAGFCLDFGHAVAAANSIETDYKQFIFELLELNPLIYHLTDGLLDSSYDSHLHFGDGNFPVKEFLSMIPDGSLVVNEASKSSSNNLDDYISDMIYLGKIIKSLC